MKSFILKWNKLYFDFDMQSNSQKYLIESVFEKNYQSIWKNSNNCFARTQQ
jgi:hypothetical protein